VTIVRQWELRVKTFLLGTARGRNEQLGERQCRHQGKTESARRFMNCKLLNLNAFSVPESVRVGRETPLSVTWIQRQISLGRYGHGRPECSKALGLVFRVTNVSLYGFLSFTPVTKSRDFRRE